MTRNRVLHLVWSTTFVELSCCTFLKALTMALLVDKHRPRSLETLSYHNELSDRLRALVLLSQVPGNAHD